MLPEHRHLCVLSSAESPRFGIATLLAYPFGIATLLAYPFGICEEVAARGLDYNTETKTAAGALKQQDAYDSINYLSTSKVCPVTRVPGEA